MNKFLRVESDTTLVRDSDSNAIINTNKSEFEKFKNFSEIKYKEKKEFENLKKDVNSIKEDLEEIKNLLKSINENKV